MTRESIDQGSRMTLLTHPTKLGSLRAKVTFSKINLQVMKLDFRTLPRLEDEASCFCEE